MKYAQHRAKMQPSQKGGRKIGLMPIVIGLLLVVIIVLVVQLNRTINTLSSEREAVVETPTETQVAEVVVTPTEVTVADVEEASTVVDDQSRFEEITIFYEDTQLVSGLGRRQIKQGEFVHVLVVDLPAINPEVHYYEGWLVQPGITDYFSTGSLFQREDGKFALVYKTSLARAPQDIFTYSDVVITREIHDGNEWPSPAHMAEGEFLYSEEEL